MQQCTCTVVRHSFAPLCSSHKLLLRHIDHPYWPKAVASFPGLPVQTKTGVSLHGCAWDQGYQSHTGPRNTSYLPTPLLLRCRYGKENVVLSDIWRPTQKILSEGECNFIDLCTGFHCLLDGATVFGVSVSMQIQRHPCIGLVSMCWLHLLTRLK